MVSAQPKLITTFSGIVAVIAMVPVLFYTTTASLVDIWITNETYTHGFLIFPICLLLIWRIKDEINQYSPNPEPRILVILMPVLGTWLISNIIDVKLVQQLSMISIIPIAIWLIYGRKLLLTIVFPLLYLIFAVPFGQSLIPPMMEFTANFTVYLIKLTGIPIYRDGLYFTLPSGNWSVVEECSGVRYIIASLALGAIYSYINYNSLRKRLMFILISLMVPILANGLRAYGIVMIGHYSGMELAVGADHLLYGWVFFGIVIFLMFYIGSFFWDPIASNAEKPAGPVGVENKSDFRTTSFLAAITITCIASVQIFAANIKSNEGLAEAEIKLILPEHFEDWQFVKGLSLNWQPEINKPDASLNRIYRFGDEVIQVNLAYFAYQREGAEAISSQNRLTNPYDGNWKIIRSTDLQEQDIYVKETVIRYMEQKILVWSWYQIGSKQTPNAYIAKIIEAYNNIVIGRKDAAIITLATTVENVDAEARLKLRRFWTVASDDIRLNLESVAYENKSL